MPEDADPKDVYQKYNQYRFDIAVAKYPEFANREGWQDIEDEYYNRERIEHTRVVHGVEIDLEEALSLDRTLERQEREQARKAIGQELGFENSKNIEWEYIIRRLLRMPLDSTGFDILDRIRELKPVLDGVSVREDHKPALGLRDK